MPFDLDTITKLLQSPPGQFVTGGAAGSIVWKFFERVEAILTETTKMEIAVWLVSVEMEGKVQEGVQRFV